MAVSTANILVGAATVSIGDYVTAGGAGTLTDVGHTNGPVTLAPTFSDFEVKSERAFGTLKRIPLDATYKLKIPLMEATLEHMRIVNRQAAAQLTGTPPNEILALSDPQEQYQQISIVGPGLGTTSLRTITLWRCIVAELGEIQFAKGEKVVFDVTFDVLYDDSVAAPLTKGFYGNVTDS